MYVDGFVAAVPKDKKEAYRQQAEKASDFFRKSGATRVVECWQEDVPHGKKTDFYGAVKAKEDEEIIFSWIEYPSKEVREEVMKKMHDDPQMMDMKDMPFDGSRMIFGGFETILEKH